MADSRYKSMSYGGACIHPPSWYYIHMAAGTQRERETQPTCGGLFGRVGFFNNLGGLGIMAMSPFYQELVMREMNIGFLIFGFSEDDETMIFVGVAKSAEAALELCADYQADNPEMYATAVQGILMHPQRQD